MSARQRRRRENRRREHAEKSPTRRRLIAAGGLTAGATLAMSGVAHATPQTYTVGTNADSSSGGACLNAANTDCSLREAISLANANAGADTIVFNSNLSGSTITLTTGQLSITDALTITGPGASQLTVYGNNASRIFHIDPATSDPVSISGMTVTGGYDAGTQGGGAIYNQDADLTISDSVISNSSAPDVTAHGGGVFSNGGTLAIQGSTLSGSDTGYGGGAVGSASAPVTITDSTISGNYAYLYGGGIWVGTADLTVQGSTISGNDAHEDGGGVYASYRTSGGYGNPVAIENSTIVGNHAVTDDGGGIWFCCAYVNDALTITGSTITGNTAATRGGGVQAYSDTHPEIENSIVSGNSATPSASSDLHAHYNGSPQPFDVSFSLIGIPGVYVNDYVPNSNLTGVDPKLGPLQDNGGPTLTRAPLACSPVIDMGSAFGLTDDQRGLARPVDLGDYPNSTATGADGSDIGAAELQTSPGASCTPPPGPSTTGQRAAAIKKCKKKYKKAVKNKRKHDALTPKVKKHLKKKLRKCKRRANQLPV